MCVCVCVCVTMLSAQVLAPVSASTCAPDPCGKCADASDDEEEEEEDEEDKIPRAEVPGGGPWSRCQSVPCRSKRRSSTSPLTGHSQGGAGRGVPAAPPRVLAGIAAFAPDVFPPTHGRHRGWPTEEEEEEEEEEEAGGGS